jgi:parallel beta-helix repeat protein/VCBS repeat-containing protein
VSTTYAADTSYYVDATLWDDTNDGSALSPWKTIARVNLGWYTSWDVINLKCWESWAETLILQDSGIQDNPITYGSYGSCDGTNNPLLLGTGGIIFSDSWAVSYVTMRGLDFSGATSILDDVGTDVIIESSRFSVVWSQCISQSNGSTLSLSGNSFDSCQILLGSWSTVSTTNIINNTFTSSVDVIPIFSVSYDAGSSLFVDGNTFTNMSGGAIVFSSNTTVTGNTFTNMCSSGTECAAIRNIGWDVGTTDISQNAFSNIGTGILVGASADAIHIESNNSSISLINNTLSNAQRGIFLSGAHDVTISGNTLFNPRTLAIEISESSVDTTYGNIISDNTLLTYNPDYPMVKIHDTVDASGTLATLSNNKYINIYKPKLPIIDVLTTGGDSYSLDKDQLTTLDPGATNFTYFGYKNYTSTGSYTGANLITNSTFASNISNWTWDNMSLTHDSTGSILHASQWVSQTGVISSNSFSLFSGALYEISGTLKNLTQTGGGHVSIHLRQDVAPGTLYADRVIDVVSTASGKTFSSYITANATVSDARLELEFSNPGMDIELDTVVVRQVRNLIRNPRTNEALLMINTGSTAWDFSCPVIGGGCPSQYGTITNSNINFPLTIPALTSQIILWRDPDINVTTPFTILRPPTWALSSDYNTFYDNTPITLSWIWSIPWVSITVRWLLQTGSLNYTTFDQTGSLSWMIAPYGAVTSYYIDVTNDIGTFTDHIDVTSNNQPPILDPANFFGEEDSASITWTLTATDTTTPANQITYNYLAGSLTNWIFLAFNNSDGTFEFLPSADFCGQVTFAYIAKDFPQNTPSDEWTAYINVACTNDIPTAIDDTLTATGDTVNLLDVLANDIDPIDTPYDPTPQIFSLTNVVSDINTHGTVTISGSYVEYVSDVGYFGPASFTYMMQDQSGAVSSTTGTVTLEVYPGANLPPMVESGSISVTEDNSFVWTLSGSDYNPGDILTFSTGSSPLYGTLELVWSGFTYTPNIDFNGTDSFTFTVYDGSLTWGIATIDITVNGTQDIPVVTNDMIGVEMGANQTLDVMINDSDADSPYAPQNLTITGFTLPTYGTLSVVGTGFSYTSSGIYEGPDSFDYVIADIDGNISNTGTVTLNISSTNVKPIAYSGAFTTDEDVTLVGMLSGFDNEGTPLSFIPDIDVTNWTLTISSTGLFTYIPDADFNGTDSFTFRVSDGVFTSIVAETVDITINPVNDAPTVVADTWTGTEDTVFSLTGLLDNDSDKDIWDTFTLSGIVSQGSKGTATLSGTTEVLYAPLANMCGTDTFAYQTVDQSGAISIAANVTVNLICINDAPTATGSSFTTTGNVLSNSGITLSGNLTASDIDLDVLEFTLESGTTNGVLVFNTGGSFGYTPDLEFTGSDSFTFSARDATITTATVTVSITVDTNNFNTAPTAYSGAFTTNEDVALIGTLSGADLEDASLTFTLGTGTTNGTLSLSSTGGFTYTPTVNYNGSDSFTFRVSDGILNSPYVTGSITVTSVNDLPTAVTESSSGTEDTVLTIPVLANDTDIDGTVGSLTWLTQPSTWGTLAIVGTGVQLTPTANFCSAAPISYSYQAVDNNGWTSSLVTSSFTLACVWDTPVAMDDAQSITEDTPFMLYVLANDSDLDVGDSLSIANITQIATGGTVAISGLWVQYTPAANFCSTTPIAFNYRTRDILWNLSNTGTVTLTILCMNDLPTIQNVSYSMTGNVLSGAVNILSGTLTGSDIESSSLIFSVVSPISSGSLSLSSTGRLSYIPAVGFVGAATWTYVASDGSGSSATWDITICVVSPDTTVAKPTCAGWQPVVVDTPAPISTPISGPGGGGGGGSAGSSTNGWGGSTAIFSYSQFTWGDNVSPWLLSQLLLGRQWLSTRTTSFDDTMTDGDHSTLENLSTDESSNSESMANVPFTTLLDIITTVVEYSRDLEMSNGENVFDIRRSGQSILKNIKSDEHMTENEKADALRAAAELLTEQLYPTPYEKEYKALKYVIRILKARETIIRETIDVFTQLLEETPLEEESYPLLNSASAEEIPIENESYPLLNSGSVEVTTWENQIQTNESIIPDDELIDWENIVY